MAQPASPAQAKKLRPAVARLRPIRLRPAALGIAASEMLELAATDPDAYLGMGSLLNFPLLHHTVIGLEALEQMEMAGYWPDIIIGCVGGGSNFSGLAAPFLGKMTPREAQRALHSGGARGLSLADPRPTTPTTSSTRPARARL